MTNNDQNKTAWNSQENIIQNVINLGKVLMKKITK